MARKNENKTFDSPVFVTVHSARNRRADFDGVSVKAVIDACVKAKVLKDDSSKYCKSITFTQEKAPKGKGSNNNEFTKISISTWTEVDHLEAIIEDQRRELEGLRSKHFFYVEHLLLTKYLLR